MCVAPLRLNRMRGIGLMLACLLALLPSARIAAGARPGGTGNGAAPVTIVSLGQYPDAVAMDEQTGHVFVANLGPSSPTGDGPTGNGAVTMLDGRTGRVLRTVTVGIEPTRIAVDAVTGQVLVLNQGTHTSSMSVLDARTGAVLATQPADRFPLDQGVDTRTGTRFVLDQAGAQSGTVRVLDARTGRLLREVRVEAPVTSQVGVDARGAHLLVDSTTGRAFVLSHGPDVGQYFTCPNCGGSLAMLDAASGKLLTTIPFPNPISNGVVSETVGPTTMALDQRRGLLFVGHVEGYISVHDARSGTLLRRINTGADELAVDEPTGRLVALDTLSSHDTPPSSTLAVYDEVSGAAVSTIPVDGTLTSLLVDSANGRAYALSAGGASFPPYPSGRLLVVDTASGALPRTVTVGGFPDAAALDPRTARLYVVNQGPTAEHGPKPGGSLSIIATATTGYPPGSVLTGPDPVALAVDEAAGHAFVANAGRWIAGQGLTGTGSVAMLDSRTGALLRTIAVGIHPTGVEVDATLGRVYVEYAGNRGGGAGVAASPPGLGILDAASGRLLTTISTDQAEGLIVDEASGRLSSIQASLLPPVPPSRVPGGPPPPPFSQSTVLMRDAATGALLTTTPIPGNPRGAALDSRAGRLYVTTDSCPSTMPGCGISVIDARSGAFLRSVTVPGGAQQVVVDAKTGDLLTFSYDYQVATSGVQTIVRLIDPANGATLHTVTLPLSVAGMATDEAHGRVAILGEKSAASGVSNPSGGSALMLLDSASGAVTQSIPLSQQARALRIDDQNGRLFLRNPDGTVDVRNLESGALLATTTVGALLSDRSGSYPVGVQTIAVDRRAGRVFVVNTQSDTVSVLDAATGAPVALPLPGVRPGPTAPATLAEQEIPALESDGAHVTRLPDGRLHYWIYAAPIGVVGPSGWRMLDPTLHRDAANGEAMPADLPFGLRITTAYTATAQATLTNEDGISLGARLYSVDGLTPIPSGGELGGAGVVYTTALTSTNVLAAATHFFPVQYSLNATPFGLSLHLPLFSMDAGGPLVIALRADPRTHLTMQASGTILVQRACAKGSCPRGGQLAYVIGPPLARVQGLAPLPGATEGPFAPSDPTALVDTAPISATLGPGPAGDTLLTLRIDPAWLRAPEHHGEIGVDLPIATGRAAAANGLLGTVSSCAPTARAQATPLVAGVAGDCAYHGLLSFALPPTLRGHIVSARFRLYTPGQVAPTGVLVAPSAEQPALAPGQAYTWRTAPRATGADIAQSGNDGYWQQWDVTALARQWAGTSARSGTLILTGTGAPVRFASALLTGDDSPLEAPVLEIVSAP